jgi:hypothetical protein
MKGQMVAVEQASIAKKCNTSSFRPSQKDRTNLARRINRRPVEIGLKAKR